MKKARAVTGRMYDLRHSFATLLYETEGDIFLVKSMMGHAKIETTGRYVHDGKDRRQKAAERLQGKLLGRDEENNLIDMKRVKGG